jgi:hypothetical protein
MDSEIGIKRIPEDLDTFIEKSPLKHLHEESTLPTSNGPTSNLSNISPMKNMEDFQEIPLTWAVTPSESLKKFFKSDNKHDSIEIRNPTIIEKLSAKSERKSKKIPSDP